MNLQHYIVYWEGNKARAVWCNTRKANEIRDDPNKRVTTWLAP